MSKRKAAAGSWRAVATKRGPALRSPDGRLFYGTAQEVRDAALMPWRRKMLADGLRFIRSYANRNETSREDLAEWAKEKRRDAIRAGRMDVHGGASVGISVVTAEVPIALKLLTDAAARYMGMSPSEYATELAISDIAAIQADARGEGLASFPLTRHERAALSAVGFDADKLRGLADYSCEEMLRKYVADVTAADERIIRSIVADGISADNGR